LTETHANDLGLDQISWLDTYRMERHQWFYGVVGLGTDEKESDEAISRAERFIVTIERILSKFLP